MAVIEALRKKNLITVTRLAREAGITTRWYEKIRIDPERASGAIIVGLADALRHIQAGNTVDLVQTTALIEAVYGGFLAALAPRFGVTPDQVRLQRTKASHTADEHWRICSHVRQGAIYLTNTVLGIGQRVIARTIGMTEAGVCMACAAVEDRRDDPVFDRLLDQATHDVTGHLAL